MSQHLPPGPRPRCVLCERLMDSIAPEATPDTKLICSRCAALSPEARRDLRNSAMIRVLRQA